MYFILKSNHRLESIIELINIYQPKLLNHTHFCEHLVTMIQIGEGLRCDLGYKTKTFCVKTAVVNKKEVKSVF